MHYPGLQSHPQHQQLTKVFSGFGGVFAFELEGGLEVADAFMQVGTSINFMKTLSK